ncbi:amino acid ABC transporter permease [Xinfangfangia sp. CPCC 101601]|uniref:Amino acid ABC transporter permease n=1 Tax=Pseudogemmobacter lacusdianii TaxID=3069608 RepID=A0ABU0W296_9RHOB|nr:amino acid ABC transporter permease [Xinfangfangia sp. CPCC 101601]MDQ2068137.1 amino acid ABC transporter permease [Xinfangfangia sp. CPCC 101601]
MMLDFSVVPPYAGVLLNGLLWTLLITALATTIATVCGILFALILLYAPLVLRWPVRFICFLIMGTPLLLQLFLVYYGLSQVGVNLPAFWTGVAALGLHYAVYNAQIMRTAILGVDPGQTEASRALGFGRLATLRHFILPQALLVATPQLGNNTLILLKDTALLSVIGITELVLSSQLSISRTFRPFEFYLTIAALYYVINLGMEWVLRRLARRLEAIK